MGAWLAERRRDELYTVGVYAYSGSAANNSGEVYEIAEPGAATLEGVMHALGRDAVFIDLSRARRGDATAWMFEAIAARYNGTEEIRLVPRDQYDGLVLVETATPRKQLE
jgi:erythromycin esterase